MKVLYIYSGKRKGRFNGRIGVDYPDTQFYGLNHLSKFGIDAEYKEVSNILKKIFGFRIAHMFMFFSVSNYDVVFGSSLMYMLFWNKFFKAKTKFVLLNISLNRTISANKDKTLKKAFLMWLLKELDGVICLSNHQKENLEKEAPFLKGRTFFTPLGVDIEYFEPVYNNREDFILSVGKDNGRDYQTVVDTARLMPEETFHIIASERNLKNIKNIPDNIKLFFDFSFDELKEKYKKAKMLLLITKEDNYSDGADCSGQTVLLDAMASGLPVIVSRKNYLIDYIEKDKEVHLVDFYDAQDIKEAVNTINNDEKRFEIAKNARKTVQNKLSTEHMAETLSFVFNKIYGK